MLLFHAADSSCSRRLAHQRFLQTVLKKLLHFGSAFHWMQLMMSSSPVAA
jgi:hypothetical protein